MSFGNIVKTFAFALCGLAGAAVGCLVFNVGVPGLPEALSSAEICLLLDTSSSMEGAKLAEVKAAAKQFVDQSLSMGQISVVTFGTSAAVAARLTNDPRVLKPAIDKIRAAGGTNMAEGIRVAAEQFTPGPGTSRYLILFTDGLPQERDKTIAAANAIRAPGERKVEMVAVGATGRDTDTALLSTLSGREAISATTGDFKEAFDKAETVIRTLDGRVTPAGLARVILHYALWAAFLAIGIGIAIIVAQNLYLRRPVLSGREVVLGIPGLALAGAVAGAAGCLAFSFAPGGDHFLAASGVDPKQAISWTLLGALLGYGLGYFIPNLDKTRSSLGGAIGGLAAAAGFALVGSGAMAQLLASSGLGFFIGLMVAIVDVVFREAWLELRYPEGTRSVGLGREPVSVGSATESTVYVPKAAPTAYRYWHKDNAVTCEDVSTGRVANIAPGDTKQLGNLVITLRTSGKHSIVRVSTVAAQPASFTLRLSTGRSVALVDGLQLTASDVPGLQSQPAGGPVAAVSKHPTDPTLRGLQNLSRSPWRLRLSNGTTSEIQPGKSFLLARHVVVNFGAAEGEIV